MRRSFGPKMGGGGGSGGGMMKTVHRAMRTGVGGGATQEPYSHAATRTNGGNRNNPMNTTLSLSSNTSRPSSPISYLNHPLPESPPHKWAFTTAPATGEEIDWEYLDDACSDGDSVNGFYDDLVFGGVPSGEEVHHAVSSLHEVLEPVSFGQLIKNRKTYGTDDDDVVEKISSPTGFKIHESESDWTEPSMQLCYSISTLQVPSSDKVLDAFHLLQTEPSVQAVVSVSRGTERQVSSRDWLASGTTYFFVRNSNQIISRLSQDTGMVISLSSDKAVWDAVMNNEVVRELRESVSEDKSIYDGLEGSADDSDPVTQVLRWIFINTKEKLIEMIEKITKVVYEFVRPMNKDHKPKTDGSVGLDSFDEKLRSSFFLSIVVLLIVVVSRSRKC